MTRTVESVVGTLPNWFEHWNPAMRGAYKKGAEAAHNGKPIISCPYEDHRKPNGKLSWSRAFIRAWEQGHTDASVFINANPAITGDRGTVVALRAEALPDAIAPAKHATQNQERTSPHQDRNERRPHRRRPRVQLHRSTMLARVESEVKRLEALEFKDEIAALRQNAKDLVAAFDAEGRRDRARRSAESGQILKRRSKPT